MHPLAHPLSSSSHPRAPYPTPRSFKKYAGLDNYPPLQVLFATKGKNKGKLDSHCWCADGGRAGRGRGSGLGPAACMQGPAA